jgi:uncharacterized protein (TIGR03382 family)
MRARLPGLPIRWIPLSLLAALTLLQPAPARAQQWFDGSTSQTPHYCMLPTFGSPLFEILSWTWVGYSSPAVVNQVYWMHVGIASGGCSGLFAVPEVRLPRNTTFAVDGAHPITCVYTDPSRVTHTFTGGDCPSAAGGSIAGTPVSGYSNLGDTNGLLYALPQGSILEIRFPVITTTALSGIATNDYVMAAVNLQDLNTGDVLWDAQPYPYSGGLPTGGAYEGVFVFSSSGAASGKPSVAYVEPTLVSVTTTTAVTAAEITPAGCAAQVYYELYPDDGSPDTTSQDLATTSCSGGASTPFSCAIGWKGLVAGKPYKWRVNDWVPNGGQSVTCDRSNVIGLPASPTATTGGWHYFKTPTGVAPTYYSLVTSAANGTIAASPSGSGGTYAPGTVVSVTATPSAGYAFDGWTLDGSSQPATNPLSVTMNASHSLVGRFSLIPVVGGGGGGGGGGTGGGGGGGGGGCSTTGPGPVALVPLVLLLLRRRRSAA